MSTASVIEDDGIVLAESGTICDYLNQKHGAVLAPAPGSADHAVDNGGHHDGLPPDHRTRVPKASHARPFSNVLAYLARIGEREGYWRAMGRCEPGWRPMLD